MAGLADYVTERPLNGTSRTDPNQIQQFQKDAARMR